jgi:alpha-ketoglutarate-dependent taurine dioxygenase
MALDKDLANIRFVRLWDLLDLPHEADRPKDYYLLHAPCFRREIMARYGDSSFDVRAYLRQNEDACLTYRGYIKFLQKDLAHSHISRGKDGKQLSGKKFKEAAENVARAMIVRGRAFAAAIKAKFGDAVRLSIHPSVGKEKLPMSLIPQKSGSFGYTPWHSCIAVGIDGAFNTVHPSDVKDTHELVYRYGRPYYYREKSDLYDWGDLQVEFEHLYPTGLIIRPTAGTPSLRDVPMKKVRELSQLQSPVVCRGFADTTEEKVFQSKAYELGEVVPWSYGIMQKVKDSGRRDKMANNVVSNEAMPMHFDGIFKFVTTTDEHGNEVKVQKPPKFQYFTAIATAPKGSGYTLFASCARFWQHLPPPYTLERLEKATWRMDNNGFWDAKMEKLPLVVRHPVTGAPCVRWHEPWPASKTKFSTCDVFMENDEQAIVPLVDSLLYDRRVCLYFTWEKGDVLVNDNFGMLHTRTGFTGDSDRELWRIHFD